MNAAVAGQWSGAGLALNTTPAIVVPVFRGFGAWRLSKWPSKAEFLRRETPGNFLGHILNIIARIPTRKKQTPQKHPGRLLSLLIAVKHTRAKATPISRIDQVDTSNWARAPTWRRCRNWSRLREFGGHSIAPYWIRVRHCAASRVREVAASSCFRFRREREREEKNGESQQLFRRQRRQHRGESMPSRRLLCRNKQRQVWKWWAHF